MRYQSYQMYTRIHASEVYLRVRVVKRYTCITINIFELGDWNEIVRSMHVRVHMYATMVKFSLECALDITMCTTIIFISWPTPTNDRVLYARLSAPSSPDVCRTQDAISNTAQQWVA
jgi:hypothetical protein